MDDLKFPDLSKLNLNLGATLPGEGLVVALLNFVTTSRASMSQENRDKWDNASYVAYKSWNNWWVDKGWPGDKI